MSPKHIALQQQTRLFLAPGSAEFLGQHKIWISLVWCTADFQWASGPCLPTCLWTSNKRTNKNTQGLLKAWSRAQNCHVCSFSIGQTQYRWGGKYTLLLPVESKVTWQRAWMDNSNSRRTRSIGNNDSISHGYPFLFESSVFSQAVHNLHLRKEAFCQLTLFFCQ